MSTPEIDERYDDLVRELRTLPGAPDALRERVLRLAEAAPEPAPRRGWTWPRRARAGRLVLVLAVLALVAVAGVAAVYGLVSSGGSGSRSEAAQTFARGGGGVRGAPGSRAKQPKATFAPATTVQALTDEVGHAAAAQSVPPPASLPPVQGRLQQYSAEMRLRVKGVDGLSKTTSRAMRITRSLGGFVASVDYGTPSRKAGEAYLTVRIPNARVQDAVVKFSGLGVILSQQISIRDLQDQANQQAVQIIRLQREIDRLVAKLRGSLSPEERVQTQSQLDAARAALRARTEQHRGTIRAGRLATFRLELTTRKAAAVPPKPHHKGRIGRAASHAFALLGKIAAGAIYGAIVLVPVLLVALLLLAASRAVRRRGTERLLARA